MGRKGKLLIQALQDAKEARRKTGGAQQNYGRVLRVSYVTHLNLKGRHRVIGLTIVALIIRTLLSM